MNAAFHAVARGLRLAHVGFLLACWGSASAVGIGWTGSSMYYYRDEMRWLLLGVFGGAVLAAVAGLVVGFVGRVRCLKAPEEYPAVRGRARMAVVLEGSGWASLFAGVGVLTAMGFKLLPQWPWVPGVGMLLSALMVFGGRVMFLVFLRALGRVVEDPETDRRARFSLALFLLDWLAGLVGLAVMAGGSALGIYHWANATGYLIWIVAGMSGLFGLLLYDRLLGGLARAVKAFADDHPADDEDGYEPAE